jgi:energy-converting hydrogenase Eha subunit C
MNLCHGIVVGTIHAIKYIEGAIAAGHTSAIGKEIVLLNYLASYLQAATKKRNKPGTYNRVNSSRK